MKEQNIITGSLCKSILSAYTLLVPLRPSGSIASYSPQAVSWRPTQHLKPLQPSPIQQPTPQKRHSKWHTPGALLEGFRKKIINSGVSSNTLSLHGRD